MIKEEFIQKLNEKIKPYFEGVNPAHDIHHTNRVLNMAIFIGREEGADLEILEVAVFLHDIARKEQDESLGKICHAEKGALLAENILFELGYPKEKISKVIHCIKTHRFRDDKNPETIEAKVLYDSDKLDSIGAIGIGRAFSFSGFIGSLVHSIEIEDSKSYDENDCAYREFIFKLNKVKDKMMSSTGKKIAQNRHNFMVEFFDRLNKEVKGEL